LREHVLQFDSVVLEQVEVVADCGQEVVVLLGLLQILIADCDCGLLLGLKLRFLACLSLGAAAVDLD